MRPTSKEPSWLYDLGLLALLIGSLYAFMLGSRPLSAPDEGRYTEIPREMVARGDYVTPRLNGVKYFEKPPLMYWLGAASIKIAGPNPWAMRFWPAFLGLITVLATYATGRLLIHRQAGWYASILLGTSLLFFAHARIVILDMAVCCLITLALFSFFLSFSAPLVRQKRRFFLWGFFLFSALAVLTKGLIGAALPGSIILLWCLITRRWDVLKSAFHPFGLLLFFAVAGPWHILAMMKNPEFFDFYIIHEHFTRYLEKAHNRYQPFYFFLPILLLGFFPWTFHVIRGGYLEVKKIFQTPGHSPDILSFCLLWAGFIFVFFSLSSSKLIPYILPVFPPLSLVAGSHLAQLEKNKVSESQRPLAYFCLTLAILIPPVAWRFGLFEETVFLYAVPFVCALLLAMSRVACKLDAQKSFIPMVLLNGLFLLSLNALWPHLDTRSVRSLALAIKEDKTQGDRVMTFKRYYQDLPPYLEETIVVASWRGELDFGMEQEDTSSWMLEEKDMGDFYAKVRERGHRLYVVTRHESLNDLYKIMGKGTIMMRGRHDALIRYPE